MINWIRKNKLNIALALVALAVGYWLGQGRSPAPTLRPLNERAQSLSAKVPGFGAEEDLAAEIAAEPEAVEEGGSPSERLVIKTGTLSLLVQDVRQSVSKMQELAVGLAGFVVDSQTTIVDEKKGTLQAAVTIRVPEGKFDEALQTLKKEAIKVESEKTSGQDVTEEYTDLQSRLKNLEATEAQLLKIMERAGEIKDVLSVQQELTRVRGQIETTKGRIKFLEGSANMSRITVHFSTEEEGLPIVEEGWKPLVTARAALRALVSFGQSAADKLIFAFIFLSPVVVIILVALVVKKFGEKKSV